MLVLSCVDGLETGEEGVEACVETGLGVHLEESRVVLGAEGLVGQRVEIEVGAGVEHKGGKVFDQGHCEVTV